MTERLGTRRHTAGMLVVSGVLASALTFARPASAQPGEPPPGGAPAEAPAAPPPPAPEAPPPPPPAPMAPEPAPAPAPVAAPPAALPVGDVAPPASPFKIETSKGNSVRIGLLLQPQFQTASSASLSSWSNNLYLRRTRILVGGTLFGLFDYFVETDYPNLFLAVPGTTMNAAGMTENVNPKNTPGMNIQDAFGTYHPLGDYFKVDVGYMLPPLDHNAVQGAGTLYGIDYFPFTFQSSNSFGSVNPPGPVGRDMGVQLRGLVIGGHLEYRAGLFQGLRDVATTTDVASRNFFRAIGRLQINLLDPETGFFYAGTYFGAKHIISLGGSVDIQDSYRYFGGDAFVDMPLGPGVITGQFNYAYWNGNSFIPTLLKQSAEMLELGYLIGPLALAPTFTFNHLTISSGANQNRFGGGVSFFPFGHNSNLKLFYQNVKVATEAKSFNQINLQWQLYFF